MFLSSSNNEAALFKAGPALYGNSWGSVCQSVVACRVPQVLATGIKWPLSQEGNELTEIVIVTVP